MNTLILIVIFMIAVLYYSARTWFAAAADERARNFRLVMGEIKMLQKDIFSLRPPLELDLMGGRLDLDPDDKIPTYKDVEATRQNIYTGEDLDAPR